MRRAVVTALMCGAILLPSSANAEIATVRMTDTAGKPVGTVTLTDSPNGVLIAVELRDMMVGEHGFHVHENGACSPDFEAAGDHFNPDGKEHGLSNPQGMHAGDLPNLFVATDGVAKAHFFNQRITVEPGPTTILDDNGSAIIVHEDPDTYLSEAKAGGRVACGVVERQQQ